MYIMTAPVAGKHQTWLPQPPLVSYFYVNHDLAVGGGEFHFGSLLVLTRLSFIAIGSL